MPQIPFQVLEMQAVAMVVAVVIRISLLLKIALICSLFLITSCEESIQPTPVPAKEKKAFEKNATDAAGVAEGDEQVSPFGKPSH